MRFPSSTNQFVTTTVGLGAKIVAVPMNGYKFSSSSAAPTGILVSSSTPAPNSALVSSTSAISLPTIVPSVASKQALQGLSTATAAGIGIGAAVGIFGLVAFVIAFFFMRQKKQQRNRIIAQQTSFENLEKRGVYAAAAPTFAPVVTSRDYYNKAPLEMSTEVEARELSGEMSPVELDGEGLPGQT
jgi:hypothetical protein